jgi:glycosyltransferase involved in cell wall biosynthesis
MISIIITCFNENNLIQKTVRSIFANTRLPFEIIIIDDASSDALEASSFSEFPGVKYFKNQDREGLIRSRIIGTTYALLPYLVFMDAHCKPEVNWEIALVAASEHFENRIIAVPFTAILDPENWLNDCNQRPPDIFFDEKMNMKWRIPPSQFTSGYLESPIFLGCTCLISRTFYMELQGFDDGLKIWGGENIDISLRCWMFGGKVIVAEESIVGHVFKSRFTYPIKQKTITLNKLRIAYINFSPERFKTVLTNFYVTEKFLFNNEVDTNASIENRKSYFLNHRIYDDHWYVEKFRIPL